jgi:ribosome-associated protein
MDIRKLQRIVVDTLDDLKAQNIKVLDTTGLSDIFDRVVVASGTSNRQTRAMASEVAEKVKAGGGEVLSVEGEETGEWVLVDLGDAVVHVMLPPIRAYYDLEEIWGGKPVRMAATVARNARKGLVKAAVPGLPGPVTRAAPGPVKRAAPRPAKRAAPRPAARPAVRRKPAASG